MNQAAGLWTVAAVGVESLGIAGRACGGEGTNPSGVNAALQQFISYQSNHLELHMTRARGSSSVRKNSGKTLCHGGQDRFVDFVATRTNMRLSQHRDRAR